LTYPWQDANHLNTARTSAIVWHRGGTELPYCSAKEKGRRAMADPPSLTGYWRMTRTNTGRDRGFNQPTGQLGPGGYLVEPARVV
jgi:hypothetical protein